MYIRQIAIKAKSLTSLDLHIVLVDHLQKTNNTKI